MAVSVTLLTSIILPLSIEFAGSSYHLSLKSSMATVSIKLLVDKEKNRVVFAESDKDFVDILFSFLTLPMGTIIRLLEKRSTVGCMDKLYESVENLDANYFETEACKTMLLQPRSAAEIACEDLVVNVDDLKPRRIYRCPNFDCFSKTHRLYSSIRGARCPCGKAIDKDFQWTRTDADAKNDVFLSGKRKYIISDDLNVAPSNITNTLSEFDKFGIKDVDALEKQTLDVGRDEVLRLLKRSLLSKFPLTDVFLQKAELDSDNSEHYPVGVFQVKMEDKKEASPQEKTISVKLLQNKTTKEIIYAEAGNDLVDVLFSFLTFPLGSVVEVLNKQTSIGCLDNLYRSVEALAVGSDLIKSEKCKNMLLSPKLYPHFRSSNQLIKLEAVLSKNGTAQGCEICSNSSITISGSNCRHNIAVVKISEVNPKVPVSVTETGGGYAKKSVKYMVTSEMVVSPYSSLSGFDLMKELKQPINSLVEKEVTVGEVEALKLLRACLVCRSALTVVFSPPKRKRICHY